MGSQIRLASAADAPQWLELFRATMGQEYPAKELYDPAWIASQLDPETGHETWVAAADDGRLLSSVSFLKPDHNRIANLGRALHRPESLSDGSAEALLDRINRLVGERGQMAVARISAHENSQQILYENMGYSCVGFQPLKHLLQHRIGVLFYVRGASSVLVHRLPISESLPQISELAGAALSKLQIRQDPLIVRDGATGYPLLSGLKVHDATFDDYELWRMQAEASNPPIEVSGRFNLGIGHMRLPSTQPLRALLGQNDQKIVAGLAYYFDEHDRYTRVFDAFSTDDLSMGALLQKAVKVTQQQLNGVYTEIDIVATAPRLLKTAEQLGFVPVAYLPGFFQRKEACADVVKLVKLNMPYALEHGDITADGQSIVRIVDHNFQQEKMGLAIINLLRPLSIFQGLGDGELRKIAHLFTQKLYRAGEQVFAKGDSSNEAYVILRGQIDIQLEERTPAIAALGNGKILGELAFLDGTPRNAFATAAQPSILLVVQRTAFQELIQREPHLGMVVMANIALDLAAKLRNANLALKAGR